MIGSLIADIVGELLWPSRCILCDTPGPSLCSDCRTALPYLDPWTACPRCGSPFGMFECCDCNAFSMALLGREAPPFDACTSALVHTNASQRIVTGLKDAGEQSLAVPMAEMIAAATNPLWLRERPVLTFIPASPQARRQRGFDHVELIATHVAPLLGLEMHSLFAPPNKRDQRELSRIERFANMSRALQTLPDIRTLPTNVLIVDDVCTTGATLYAASDALRAAGVRTIRAVTFSRV